MSGRSATHPLISSPDRPGIVAAVSALLFERGANIVEADQYATEIEGGTFYMRMAFQLEGTSADDFERGFAAARVSRLHATGELAAIGRDIERIVLARAVCWHLQDRVIVHENRTVAF